MIPKGRLLWIAGVIACVAAACEPGDDPANQPEVLNCDPIEPGDSPIRRMTRAEYNNTVRDLLGDESQPASSFVPEEEALGFNNQATSLGVTQLLAEQMMNAAEAIAQKAVADLGVLMPYCDVATAGEDACATMFIERFGKRAFRRPITPAEAARFFELFAWGRTTYDFASGLGLVIQAMLQSPTFLYRVELGMPDPIEGDVVPLGSYEIASRLSYLLWNSMPDDEVFAAADAGELTTKEQIAAQARRMLDHPRARQAVANFHSQWLKLTHIETVAKDPATYPLYHEGLRSLWKQETEAFLEHVVFDGEGDVGTLLSAPYSMMNAELAAFYGVADPSLGEAFERVELDPSERAGLLTQASLLAVNAKPNQSSPIHRGKFVREMLLCQTLPPPPNDIEIKPPEVKPGTTTRDRFKEHAESPACSPCHVLMDPIGFGFENFDGIGLWREEDQGFPVDASGYLHATRDIDGAFNGAVELAKELASSAEVRQCVATQWFRFGYGRAEGKTDACAMREIQGAFALSGNNIKELLVGLTQTEAFLYRHRPDPTK